MNSVRGVVPNLIWLGEDSERHINFLMCAV